MGRSLTEVKNAEARGRAKGAALNELAGSYDVSRNTISRLTERTLAMSTPSPDKDSDPIAAAIQSFKAEHRAVADEDSAYKKKSLFWSRLTFSAVTIYTVFTGILLWMSRCSLDETRTEFETNQRPWVYADVGAVPAGPLSFDKNGAQLQLKVQFHNSGNTPAVSVFPSGILIFDESEESFLPSAWANTQRRRLHCHQGFTAN
jgi:hypothetical protein